MDQWEGDGERHHGSFGQDSRTTVLTRTGLFPSGAFFIPNKNGTNTTFVCFIEILGPFCRKSIDKVRVC